MNEKIDRSIAVVEGDELTITRIFHAAPRRVYAAWTDPEQVVHWYGPKGFTTPFCRMDVRPGGSYLICMRSPAGTDYWSTGIFREVEPEKRIVSTDSFADEQGNVVPASHYGMITDMPLEMLVTVTFAARKSRDGESLTELNLYHLGIPEGADRDGARQGWNESLDKLADFLARSS